MIEAAVDRGIREMQEDPKRSVRKLADLGKQFSRGRFQQNFFDLSQTLLQDDNSPYYTILSRLTRETNHETLKKFGVNIGYTSWTYGASLIRSYEKEHGYDVPWTIFIHYLPDGPLGPEQIDRLIQEGRSIGVYTYFIYLEEMPEDWTALTKLFHSYDNSAFLLLLPDRELEEADCDLLSECRNLLVSAEIASCYRENIRLLKQRGCIVANHYYYHSSDLEEIARQVKDCESPLLLFKIIGFSIFSTASIALSNKIPKISIMTNSGILHISSSTPRVYFIPIPFASASKNLLYRNPANTGQLLLNKP